MNQALADAEAFLGISTEENFRIMESYRNIIIGSGYAGKAMAWHLAQQGDSTICIERSQLGGACPNIACLPTKNIIRSAKAAAFVRKAANFGISVGEISIDIPKVVKRKSDMVENIGKYLVEVFKDSGAEVAYGEAAFVGPMTIQISLKAGGSRILQGERIFIATGTKANIPDIPGLRESDPLTHVEALDIAKLPEHLVILGGGYVGLELAETFRRFGSRVTLINRGHRLLKNEDPDVSEAMEELMKDEGVEILNDARITRVEGTSGKSLSVHITRDGTTETLAATDLLVAAGRIPNTVSLAPDVGGIAVDARGFIKVNDRLETNIPNVWAMGEVAGSPQFTHVASDDFAIVRDNLAGGNRSTKGRLVPAVLFTDPELARVGLNELEAKARGIKYRIAYTPMAAVLRMITISETRGFAKALIGEDDRILGLTVFGAEASELLAAVQTAMLAEVPYSIFLNSILPHPTAMEGLAVLFANVPPKA